MDFRHHKMAGSGFTSIGNFRKLHSARAKQSKFKTEIKTAEELVQEKFLAEMEKQMQEEQDEEEDVNQLRKKYTVDDITAGLDSQMKIAKIKKSKAEKLEALQQRIANKPISKPGEKISALKQKHKNKRSRK